MPEKPQSGKIIAIQQQKERAVGNPARGGFNQYEERAGSVP